MSTLDTPVAQGGHDQPRVADTQSIWALRWRRFRGHRTGVASLVVLALLVAFCLMAGPLEAWRGIDATQTDLFKRYQPISAEHRLGPTMPGATCWQG